MTLGKLPKEIRMRLLIAGMLATGALVLFAAQQVADRIQLQGGTRIPDILPHEQEIEGAIDALLARYRIEKTWVRTWRVLTPNKKLLRIERRVFVPPTFVSVTFNHDLNQLLSQYGSRAVASERGGESTVTMHVIKNGRIIESITFVVQRDLNSPG